MNLKPQAAAYLSLILVGACSLYLGSWPAALVLGLSVVGLTVYWTGFTRASIAARVQLERQKLIQSSIAAEPAPPSGSMGATQGGSGSDTGAAHFDSEAA